MLKDTRMNTGAFSVLLIFRSAYYFTKEIYWRRQMVKDYIEERTLDAANYIISKEATVRQAAKIFGVSKSTIHKDVTERLPKINPSAAKEVKMILDKNKAERHIRGGRATKMKYESEGNTESDKDV